MRVDWKIKAPPPPWWFYGFLALGLPLYVACLRRQMGPDFWTILGVQIAFFGVGFGVLGRLGLPFKTGFVEFDGRRLAFSGGTMDWCLADVDSVVIHDGMIRIRLHRAGGMGDEFTAEAERMLAESWAALAELCRKIQAAMQPCKPTLSPNLEEVAY